jgi:hypothetical protein
MATRSFTVRLANPVGRRYEAVYRERDGTLTRHPLTEEQYKNIPPAGGPLEVTGTFVGASDPTVWDTPTGKMEAADGIAPALQRPHTLRIFAERGSVKHVLTLETEDYTLDRGVVRLKPQTEMPEGVRLVDGVLEVDD